MLTKKFYVNPLYTNGFFLLVCYNKLWIVHCTYLGMSGYNLKKNVFCLKIFFTFTNSVDPDEMQHNAAFHQGLHCMQKYSFSGFPNTKGVKSTVFMLNNWTARSVQTVLLRVCEL